MNPEDFRDSPTWKVVLHFHGYWAFLPGPLPPALVWTSDLIAHLSDADRALGELAGLGRSLLNPHLLVRPFVRREAVLSSRIEGTQASLADLFAYEARQLHLPRVNNDVAEVLNYVRALESGLERLETLPISLRMIREIHARLMENVRGEESLPGQFRRSQNWIGAPGSTLETATYVPPPPEDLMQPLDELEKFLHESSNLPPLIRLGMIHYQFEAIHPFLDGNGRVGRLLISLLLCAWGLLPQPLLYLSAFFESRRQAYYERLLGVSQTGAWDAWLSYFLEGVGTQARDAVQRIRRLQDLREDYRSRFQTAWAAARLLLVVDLLFTHPLVTIPQIAAALEIEYKVAQRYVAQLVKAGMLREITGRARNRLYRADEIMAALERPLAERKGD